MTVRAAYDTTVWRAFGDPLVRPTGFGPLDGLTLAVKDVFAVAGQRVGGGVPDLHREQPPAAETASAVGALLDAGAAVRGIATTDQLAYSVAGRNPFYGVPPNPAAPGRLPGGSSSGPASAVALGAADIGVATDTAGSIRVPASYQGLWGLRTTHGLVSTDGVLPLAPSFDTVGWLARDGATLAATATVLPGRLHVRQRSADGAPAPDGGDLAWAAPPAVVVAPAVTGCAEPAVQAAFAAALGRLAATGTVTDVSPVRVVDVPALYDSFRVMQAAEAWRSWGAWLTAHPGAVVGDVAARFADAATVTAQQARAAQRAVRAAGHRLDDALGSRVLLLPSAASPAPPVDADPADVQAARTRTLSMTTIAGATGRPAVSVPLLAVEGAPVGLCLVGPRRSDLALVELGRRFAAALGEETGARAG